MASLTERQGQDVLTQLALFDDETLGLDASAVLFDQEQWDIIYADELAEVLMPILVDGWISGTAKLRAAIGKAAKAVKVPIDGWDVFNQEVLSWAQRYPRFFAERVNTAFAKRITEVIASGLAKGENIRDLRKRLSRDVFNGDVTKYRAEMIARTEGSRAAHAGENQAWQQSGVVEAKVWKAFSDACQFCLALDGKTISMGEHYFELGQEADGVEGGKMPMNYETVEAPPLHPHCLIGETPVLAPDKIAGFVAAYDGPIIEITLADARRLAVSPQHVLATSRGLVPAGELREGDDLIDCSSLEGVVGREPDDDWQPPSIEQEVETLAKACGSAAACVPVAPEYLHGDAAFVDSDIYVVWANRKLRDRFDAAPGEPVDKALLTPPDADASTLARARPLAVFLERVAAAFDRPMGRFRVAPVFSGGALAHHKADSLANAAQADAKLAESVGDGAPAGAGTAADACNALAAEVGTAKITKIERVNFTGHVFDLQTFSSLYIANGILSSNCHCDEEPVLRELGE